MTQATVIRRATIDDLDGIAVLARRTFLEAYQATNDPAHLREHLESEFAPERIRDVLLSRDAVMLLAARNGRLAGYAQLRFDSPCPEPAGEPALELARFYVDSSEQGAGIGGDLIRDIVRLAAESGHRGVWLQVWERNPGARRFYERMGFSVVGETGFMMGRERQSDFVMMRPIEANPDSFPDAGDRH